MLHFCSGGRRQLRRRVGGDYQQVYLLRLQAGIYKRLLTGFYRQRGGGLVLVGVVAGPVADTAEHLLQRVPSEFPVEILVAHQVFGEIHPRAYYFEHFSLLTFLFYSFENRF
jgi:hypothetical protein